MASILKTRSVADALHGELRQRILGGHEAPGSALTEISVSGEFEVARPTARAAIERLIAEGLLVRGVRGSGPTVPRLDSDDIRDLYSTRIAIESLAHRRLCAGDPDLSTADAANTRLLAAATAGDAVALVDADVEFHRALVALTGSQRLGRLHDLLMDEAHLCMAQVQARQLLTAQQISGEHDRILAAIRAQDLLAVDDATREHLTTAERKLLAHLAGELD